MVEISRNIIKQSDIDQILYWFKVNDGMIDDRGNVASKVIDKDHGPMEIVDRLVSTLLDFDYEYEKIMVLESRASAVRLHVDTNSNDPKTWGRNILIPLSFEGQADTIWFDNHFYGNNARFMHNISGKFEYQMRDDNNTWNMVPDVRIFREYAMGDIAEIDGKNYTITQGFINLVNKIVAIRESGINANYSPRNTDYDRLTGYDASLRFDSNIQKEYMSHIPLEDLHGLTIDKIVEWKVGETYIWDRSQLHTASSRHTHKIGLSIFTNRKL